MQTQAARLQVIARQQAVNRRATSNEVRFQSRKINSRIRQDRIDLTILREARSAD